MKRLLEVLFNKIIHLTITTRICLELMLGLVTGCFGAFYGSPAMAIDTTTLPSGVRAFVYKYMDAAVPNEYGSTGATKNFNVNQTLTATLIKSVSPDVEDAYNKLNAIDPNLAGSLDMGSVDLKPKISVKANAFALGWGLTDRLMVIAAVPVMSASITVDGGYNSSGSIQNTISSLNNYAANMSNPESERNSAKALANALQSGVPTPKGEYLQGVITNDYGYKPIGNWEATGLGDAQLFAMYKILNQEFYHQAVKVGMIFPTGRASDPDSLVDVPFGTGYYSTFLETLHDFTIVPTYLTLSLMGRYQYNWAADRTYRLAPSYSFPLTSAKETINYKPGNEASVGAEVSTKVFRSLGIFANYIIKHKSSDDIQGQNPSYDYGILRSGTDSLSHTFTMGIGYSTVDLFLRKKFPIPFKIGANFSRVVQGINTQQVNITGLDFEMYF